MADNGMGTQYITFEWFDRTIPEYPAEYPAHRMDDNSLKKHKIIAEFEKKI